MKIAVAGAGFAGLATASLLARAEEPYPESALNRPETRASTGE